MRIDELIVPSIRCGRSLSICQVGFLTEISPGLADTKTVWNGPFVLN